MVVTYGPKEQTIVPKGYLNSGKEDMGTKKEVATKLKKGQGLRITAHVTTYAASINAETDTIEVTIGKDSGQTVRLEIPKGYGLDLMGKDLDLIIVERD